MQFEIVAEAEGKEADATVNLKVHLKQSAQGPLQPHRAVGAHDLVVELARRIPYTYPVQRRRLGKSAITVSDICLGTMTFGEQADEAESFAIMDRAYDAGVNFFDAAEIYPVPPSKEKFGVTEEIVGKWLKGKARDSLVIATKVTGPGHGWFVPPVREGMTALDRHHITRAVEGSLTRLGTDYIDLYQTHWPDHGMRYEDTLAALTGLVEAGKVRALGCSNETCWGVMKSLAAAELDGLHRYDTIQNNFSMLNRRCESELAQVCRQEGVSLLPYSPLAGGVLCGKYQDGALPDGARLLVLHPGRGRAPEGHGRALRQRPHARRDRALHVHRR